MNSHIVYSKEKYIKYNEDLSDNKVLYVWTTPEGKCRRCYTQKCVGRMSVRKNTSQQYAMGVCRECFDKE